MVTLFSSLSLPSPPVKLFIWVNMAFTWLKSENRRFKNTAHTCSTLAKQPNMIIVGEYMCFFLTCLRVISGLTMWAVFFHMYMMMMMVMTFLAQLHTCSQICCVQVQMWVSTNYAVIHTVLNLLPSVLQIDQSWHWPIISGEMREHR